MNIFVLSADPVEAARMQFDKHVVKMILESAQMLCTAGSGAYKPTHKNHPCTLWAGASAANFRWLRTHGFALCDEYTFRYGKDHKSRQVIDLAFSPEFFPLEGLTPFAQAMPEELRSNDAVASYRRYYRTKAEIARWTRREPPAWWNEIPLYERSSSA